MRGVRLTADPRFRAGAYLRMLDAGEVPRLLPVASGVAVDRGDADLSPIFDQLVVEFAAAWFTRSAA